MLDSFTELKLKRNPVKASLFALLFRPPQVQNYFFFSGTLNRVLPGQL